MSIIPCLALKPRMTSGSRHTSSVSMGKESPFVSTCSRATRHFPPRFIRGAHGCSPVRVGAGTSLSLKSALTKESMAYWSLLMDPRMMPRAPRRAILRQKNWHRSTEDCQGTTGAFIPGWHFASWAKSLLRSSGLSLLARCLNS